MDAAIRRGKLIRLLADGLLCLYLAFGWFVGSRIHGGLDPAGAPVGYDFRVFYEAGRFAAAGHAEKAYDDEAMFAAERAATPGVLTRLPWNYPPSFQLLMLPLSRLPYLAAWGLWSIAGFAAYAFAMRLVFAPPGYWLALAAPGAAFNLLVGQNGLLTTALIGGGVMLLSRRPLLAGLLLGAMSYKPHLAILIPVALLCGREWKALAGMVAAGLGLVAVSTAFLGTAPWLAFIDKMLKPASLLAADPASWGVRPSIMAMAQNLGLPDGTASIVQWFGAAAAALCVGVTWRVTTDGKMRAATLALGAVLATPFLRSYDLLLLMLPVAALFTAGASRVRAVAWVLAAICFVLPVYLLFARPLVPFAPLIVIAATAMLVRRPVSVTCSAVDYPATLRSAERLYSTPRR